MSETRWIDLVTDPEPDAVRVKPRRVWCYVVLAGCAWFVTLYLIGSAHSLLEKAL